MIIAKFAFVVIIGYLLGSIPFGLLLSRRGARLDVRQYGSGKIGATNVLRTAGKKVAAISAALDVIKGVLAVVFAGLIIGNSYLVVGNFSLDIVTAQSLAALAAIAGHNWSVFLRFHGGRGVATFFGGLFVLSWVVALSCGAALLLTAGVTRYASLGSITGAIVACAILLPLTIIKGYPIEHLAYAFIGAVIIIVMHRDNIARLIAGKERRLGEKADKRGIPAEST